MRSRASAASRDRAGRRPLFVATGVIVALGLVALLPLLAGTRPARQQVVVVARDMGFYLDGESTRNPTIQVQAGAEITIVLSNEDAGIMHDFRVDALRLAVEPLQGKGRRTATFRAPARPGRYEYTCTPHTAMMRGVFEVR